MQKIISLRMLPSEAASDIAVKNYLARSESINPSAISGYYPLKRSIDARGRQPWINLSVKAYINEPFQERETIHFDFKQVKDATNR
ncbi:MAG TPA: hypothetical protein VMZ03_14405, partial [Chitinophagaceae bacterium]|nr:hypothetical protein [Chitinophagaceae bacterium]